MKKQNIKIFIYSIFIIQTFLLIQNTYGMQRSNTEELEGHRHKKQRLEERSIIGKIREDLRQYAEVSNDAAGKEITVFIGNTGVGKSTLINVLANFNMRVDYAGRIIPEDESAALVSSSHNSVTHCPQRFLSNKIGYMYDLPGFLDTGGTVEDFLNASAIHGILTKASSVKVVLLTSQAELEGARGMLSKELGNAVSMFDREFINTSCVVVVNRVDEDTFSNGQEFSTKHLKNIENIKDISSEKILFLKRARPGDGDKYFEEIKENLFEKLYKIKNTKIQKLNMSRTFSETTNNQIKELLYDSMKRFMEKTNKERYDFLNENSENLRKNQNTIWKKFKSDIENTEEYVLFYEICPLQYAKAFDEFEPYFLSKHQEMIYLMQINENIEEIKEAKNKKEEAEKKEKSAKEEVIKSQKQLKEKEKEKIEAEKNARLEKEKAEAAQKDVQKSQQEKAEALLKAEKLAQELKKKEENFIKSIRDHENKVNQVIEEEKKKAQAAEKENKIKRDLEDKIKKERERSNQIKRDMERDIEQQKRISREEFQKKEAEYQRKVKELEEKKKQDEENSGFFKSVGDFLGGVASGVASWFF